MAANQIEDRLAIRQNFDKHWVSVDNKDYEVLRTVFSNDAVLEMFLDGKQAIHGSIDEEFPLFAAFSMPASLLSVLPVSSSLRNCPMIPPKPMNMLCSTWQKIAGYIGSHHERPEMQM